MNKGELIALISKPDEALTHRDIEMLRHLDYMIEVMGPEYLDTFPDNEPATFLDLTTVSDQFLGIIRIS